MIGDPFRDTVTCTVCGFARGTRVQLACCCRGWVAFWRAFLAEPRAARPASHQERTS